MKTFGIILIVIGCLNFIFSIVGMCIVPEYAEAQARQLSGSFIFFVIGGLLIHSANKKNKKNEEREKWNQ